MDRQALHHQAIIPQLDSRYITLPLGTFLLTSYNYPKIPFAILICTINAAFSLLVGSIICLAILTAVVLWKWLADLRTSRNRMAEPRVSLKKTAGCAANSQTISTETDKKPEIIFFGKREVKNLQIDAWLDEQVQVLATSSSQTTTTRSTQTTATDQPSSRENRSRSCSRSRQSRVWKPKERSLSPRSAPDYVHPLQGRSKFAKENISVQLISVRDVIEKRGWAKKSGGKRQGSGGGTVEELVDGFGRLGI